MSDELEKNVPTTPVEPGDAPGAEETPEGEGRDASGGGPEPGNGRERSRQEGDSGRGKGSGAKMELYDWVQCIVGALVLGIIIFMFGVRVVNVKGSSMYPTLHTQDKILTTNLFYTPKPGDIVVVQTNTYGPEPLVKRVIAVGGQTVDIDFDAGVVYVDGEAQDEPYVNSPTTQREDFVGPVTIPEGSMFLMGDNRNRSSDSRSSDIGLVDERCVIGKVLMIVFPSNLGEYYEPVKRELSRLGSVY